MGKDGRWMNPEKGRWFLELRCHGIFWKAEPRTEENPSLQKGQVAMALPLLVSLYPTYIFVNSSQNTWPSLSCQDSHWSSCVMDVDRKIEIWAAKSSKEKVRMEVRKTLRQSVDWGNDREMYFLAGLLWPDNIKGYSALGAPQKLCCTYVS